MSNNKQIVIDEDLHKEFHKKCIEENKSIKAATEELIVQALGEESKSSMVEKMYVESKKSTDSGGPMRRHG